MRAGGIVGSIIDVRRFAAVDGHVQKDQHEGDALEQSGAACAAEESDDVEDDELDSGPGFVSDSEFDAASDGGDVSDDAQTLPPPANGVRGHEVTSLVVDSDDDECGD